VQPLSNELCKRLRLKEAAEAEAAAEQNLVPATPLLERVGADSSNFGVWLQGQMRDGLSTTKQVVVAARKAQHGVRPVPVWGLPERVIYRALVDFILRNDPPLDRGPDAYLHFVEAPVVHARELDQKKASESGAQKGVFQFLTVGSSSTKYVVQSDITAFYEYVDHGVLARELLTKTGDHEAIQALTALLGECQGHDYGLPQLLYASDRLSEVYADIVERNLLRKGWAVWRFNDDFRVAVSNYADALACLEDLAAAAREVGLTLNEVKTTTPRFTTYSMDHFGLSVDAELPEELRLDDPVDVVADYTEGAGEPDPAWAFEVLSKAWSPETPPDERAEDGLQLSTLNGDGVRQLRRALGRAIRATTPDVLDDLVKFFAYAPSLTPWLCRYAVASGASQLERAATVLDQVLSRVSLGDWQRLWVLTAVDDLSLLGDAAPGDVSSRASAVNQLLHGRHSALVASQALLTLAAGGYSTLEDVEHGLRERPDATKPWHLAALVRLHARGLVTPQQYSAYRDEGGLERTLLVAPQGEVSVGQGA